MTKCQKDPTCGIFLKGGLFKDIKNDIPIGQMRKYQNTHTKYTNTANDEVSERPNMWYISENRFVQRYKQARKSSEDTHFTGYARFEKEFGLGKLWVKRVFGKKTL